MLSARSVKEHSGIDDEQNNLLVCPQKNIKTLKFAVIYGANASGKSNLIKCVAHMREGVLRSVLDEKYFERLSQNIFCLDEGASQEPSLFEITFLEEGNQYRYGFEFYNAKVISEWLFKRADNSTRESYCFVRENNEIKVNSRQFRGAKGLSSKTRQNALFISICSQFNVSDAMVVKEWFRKKLNIISGDYHNILNYTAFQFQQNESMRKMILAMMTHFDTGIKSIDIKESNLDSSTVVPIQIKKIMQILAPDSDTEKIKKLDIFTHHEKFKAQIISGTQTLPFEKESEGTQILFSLSGPLLETIRSGGTLFVDEFGANFHTQLSIELIKIFQSQINNSAQLIVASHDTTFLRKELLRRDQIWFTEKDNYGATDLYSLVEYRINRENSVRNDASFGKDYLQGKYGAIPYFGNLREFTEEFLNDKFE